MSRFQFLNWLQNEAEFECLAADAADDWSSIRSRDQEKYLWYWQISNVAAVENLLNNRQFAAGLEAGYKRKAGQEMDHILERLTISSRTKFLCCQRTCDSSFMDVWATGSWLVFFTYLKPSQMSFPSFIALASKTDQ
jgi:hypothetical protein